MKDLTQSRLNDSLILRTLYYINKHQVKTLFIWLIFDLSDLDLGGQRTLNLRHGPCIIPIDNKRWQ